MEKKYEKILTTALLTLAAAILVGGQRPVAASPTLLTNSGRTAVELSPALLDALSSLGISAGSVGVGPLRSSTVIFPIYNGGIDLETAKGEINHEGGLYLTRGTTRVELISFNIDTTGMSPVLTGLVVVNGSVVGRVPLFNLALPALSLPLRLQFFNSLVISPVGLTLTPQAAAALNSVFATSAFVSGFGVGQAGVFAVGLPYRPRYYFFL